MLTGLYTEKAFYDKAAGVLAQNPETAFDIIAVDIEHFKIVVVQLHLGAGNDVEAHAQKNFLQLAQHQLKRVAPALRGAAAGQRHVHGLYGQALRQYGV